MTAMEAALVLGGSAALVMLAGLALLVVFRPSGVESDIDWPLDVYIEERRLRVQALNDLSTEGKNLAALDAPAVARQGEPQALQRHHSEDSRRCQWYAASSC